MQYFMKLYPCVDKDIEHEVFLKSTEKSFKEKKVCVIITDTIPLPCITFV